MKKAVAILLAGMLLCAACGRPEGEDLPGTITPEQSGNVDGQGQTKDPEQPDESVSSLPTVTVETRHLLRYHENGEVLLAELSQDNMTLAGEGYEKAAEAVRDLFYTDEETLAARVDSYAEMAKEQYEEQKGEGWFSNYSLSTTYEIARLDTKVLSVRGWSYDYSGGAHGNGGQWGTTIDLQSGQELALTRLAEDAPGFLDKALVRVISELSKRTDELFADYESYVKENLESVNWYLDAAGIEFVFTPYEIGPYSSGNIVVCVPYGEVAEYMKQEYLEPQGEYVSELPVGIEAAADGVSQVLIETRQVQEYLDETFLLIDGKETTLGESMFLVRAYLMHVAGVHVEGVHMAGGKTFLIYTKDWASDDFETIVYELTENGAVQTDSVWAELDGKNLNPAQMGLRHTLNVFGTYFAPIHYALGEDGKFTKLEDVYPINADRQWHRLVTVRELPVTMNAQETKLPVGSAIYITAADDAGTAWFEGTDASGGSVAGEIHYERREDDYELYIDNVSEYEYFESLPYAG